MYDENKDYCGPGGFTVHTSDRNNRICYKHDNCYKSYRDYFSSVMCDEEFLREIHREDPYGELMYQIFDKKLEAGRAFGIDRNMGHKRTYASDSNPKHKAHIVEGPDLPSNVVARGSQSFDKMQGNITGFVHKERKHHKKKYGGHRKSLKRMIMDVMNPFQAYSIGTAAQINFGTVATPVFNTTAGYNNWLDLAYWPSDAATGVFSSRYHPFNFAGKQRLLSTDTGLTSRIVNQSGDFLYVESPRLHYKMAIQGVSPESIIVYEVVCKKHTQWSPLHILGYGSQNTTEYPVINQSTQYLGNNMTLGTAGTGIIQTVKAGGYAAEGFHVVNATSYQQFNINLALEFKKVFKIVKRTVYTTESGQINLVLGHKGIMKIDFDSYMMDNVASGGAQADNQGMYLYKPGDKTLLVRFCGKMAADGTATGAESTTSCKVIMRIDQTGKYVEPISSGASGDFQKIVVTNLISGNPGTNPKVVEITQTVLSGTSTG
jgi:hypothetical protein